MAAKPGLGLLEALEMARRKAEASQQQAAPVDYGKLAMDVFQAPSKAAGAVNRFIGDEGKRLIDGKFGFEAMGEALPKLAQSGSNNLLEALGTQRGGWSANDLQAERDRTNMGQAAGGALDASMFLPGVGLVPKMGKGAGGAVASMADDLARQPAQLSMGFGFGGKDGEKPLFSALMDSLRGKPKQSPLDQFTPPTSIDDIGMGYAPRGPREMTGGSQNPAGLEGSAFNDPRFGNGAQKEIPYDPAMGFQGADARMAQAKNRNTLAEALAKAKREGASENDLLGLLLAYGGLGGMSAGALATMDAQQKAPALSNRGF